MTKEKENSKEIKVNLLDPESCILDCNKGEKLITEMNNHLCLGEYELARTFFKQIIEIEEVPLYMKYFFKIIFNRGIPDKWLLTNQIRTSANYLWILYQDYKYELSAIPNCPKIILSKQLLKSNNFDLLITTAFYNSYENLENFEMPLEFLRDLRNIYNVMCCLSSKNNFFLPKLRILSPDVSLKGLILSIEEKFYEEKTSSILDFTANEQKVFMESLKNFILTQPILSKRVIEQILLNCTDQLSLRSDVVKIQEIFHIIYVDLIMVFIYFQDYERVYEYLKYIPFNHKIELCKSYVLLLFSVIVALTHINTYITPTEILKFTAYCIKNLFLDIKNAYINNFKKLFFFSNTQPDLSRIIENDEGENQPRSLTKDEEKWFLKHKVYESLLANANSELLANLHKVQDLFIAYQTYHSKIPNFFENYANNIAKKEIFSNLSYEELMNLILSYSRYNISTENLDESTRFLLWNKANKNIFWTQYLNFLRVHEEHCIGYMLKQSIKYVEKRKFDTAVILLHPLNNLKLFLILSVWDKFEDDINSRKEILEIFWKSYLEHREPDSINYTLVQLFEDNIINLDYVINFSIWIKEKLKNDDANKLYSDLLAYSIPFVMKNYLIDFDFNELLNYFIERFPDSNKKLQQHHFHSTMIIFSFFFYHLILKKIEDYFTNSSENNENPLFTEKEKEEMLKILEKIILVPYRLNIIGDIFNFIFLKIKYFQPEKDSNMIILDQTQQQHPNSNLQFYYHKKIFLEIVKFLKVVMKPFDSFDFSNLNLIFEENYLSEDMCQMIKSVEEKEIFLEDLKYIDTDYLKALKINSAISYKDFLVMKSENLKFNVDELVFRFNIVDNPWLEIIYENNENNSFLATILQNSQHYLQVAKKFHMWGTAEEIIRFFKLPEHSLTEIHLLKYFTDLKAKFFYCVNYSEFPVESLIDFNYLNKLLINDIKKRITVANVSPLNEQNLQKKLNFEYFKILFDLSLTENINTVTSTMLMDKAITYLENSHEKNNTIFYNIIDRYKVFIDPHLSKVQKEDSLSKMIVSTKNLEAVDITSLKNHLKILSNQLLALQNLLEIVNQPNAAELSHEELIKYFTEAKQTLIDYEEYNYKKMEHFTNSNINSKNLAKPKNQTNYLKMFLNYLMKIGDIYCNARIKYKHKGSNYLQLLKKYPKEIIAKLFLKYNSEFEALQIAKETKTDLISVILEYTKYYRKSIIHYTEFNNYFNELLMSLENTIDNRIINLDTFSEKEEWVKGSEKTFPFSMRILEFIYGLFYSKSEHQEDYYQYVPLFVSLYRIDFDYLSDEEQVKFWTLLIEKYNNDKIFNNYIKMIFTKFYFYKTFYQKNNAFKHLYDLINNKSGGSNGNTNRSKVINEKYEMYKRIHLSVTQTDKNERNTTTNTSGSSATNSNNKDNNDNSSSAKNLNSLFPKTFSFMPTTNEYIGKLTGKVENYLQNKLEMGKSNDYLKFMNVKNPRTNTNTFTGSSQKSEKDETAIPLPKFTNLQNLSYKTNINFYENLCSGLLAQKQYDLALEIANNNLDDTKTEIFQLLINEIVINTNEEEKLFKLLIRMKDKKKVFEYAKHFWYDWKPETTITILRLIKDEFECGFLKEEISNMIKKLKVFSSIIERNILPHMTLKKLEGYCTQDMKKILEDLMQKNSHELCYKLLRVYDKYDLYKNKVKFSEIKLLLSTNDIQNKIQALDKLAEVNENKINFCTQLIKELNNYQNKLLIINYLLHNHKNEFNEEINSLVNQKIAIKVFFLIPKDLQDKLVHLINYPELIIETLLINMRFDIIKNIFHFFPKLQKDHLITFYAEKAMSFRKINKKNESDSQINNSNLQMQSEQQEVNYDTNDLVILTAKNQIEMKSNHLFKTVPDFELFVKFMEICKDLNIIANVCFEVSNNCSKYLLMKNPKQPKTLFINFISKVLKYLELRLDKYEDTNEYDKNKAFDNIKDKLNMFSKLTELFKEFIYQEIDDLVDLELNKFYEEENYKEMVRDKLIDNDYLNLAVKYCDELNIDSTRVDLEIGLFSLKNRNFTNARKVFDKILSSSFINISTNLNQVNRNEVLNSNYTKSLQNNISNYKPYSGNNSNNQIFPNINQSNLSREQHYEVVNQIIKILQINFNLKIDELEKIYRYLNFRLSCGLISNEENTLKILDRYKEICINQINQVKENSEENYFTNFKGGKKNPIHLDKYIDVILLEEYLKYERKVIVIETLYYVKSYGTTTQLLNFYIDNDLLDETINHVINNRIPLDVFTEEVVSKCFEKRKMIFSLCASLQKVSQSNKYAKELIEQVKLFLTKIESHEDLIEVYVIMNDYLRAGFESINLIKKTEEIELKLRYYNKAAENMNKFLSNNLDNLIKIETEDPIFNSTKKGKKIERKYLEKILKLLDLQIEVYSVKKDIAFSLITNQDEDRYKIIQEIITLDDSLALAIIKEYNLRLADIFMKATVEFITKKNFSEFENLLQTIVKWNTLGIINQFSENYNQLWDNILLQAISLISVDDEISKQFAKENIIPRFQNDESRMYSLNIIGEVQNALILAFQLKSIYFIQEVKNMAEANNDKDIIDLINNFNY